MGKRLTQQARGKGSLTFRVRRAAYKYKIGYPRLDSEGKFTIIKLLNSAGHSAPLMKAVIGTETFISPAIRGVYEGQELEIGGKNLKEGNIIKLKDIPTGTRISNIEKVPGKGGVFMRVSGSSAVVTDNDGKVVEININNRRRIKINGEARASIGTIAGDGRKIKPMVKAGTKHHLMLAKGRKWHRTSPIKTNSVDHPFGSGRGKRIKSKIAQRYSSPGQKVGHIRPSRTGKK